MVQGFWLPLTPTPVQSKSPPEVHLSADRTDLIMAEVEELKRKEAIDPVFQAPGGFVSQLFLIPKKDRGFFPVINLKALNRFIQEEHFTPDSSGPSQIPPVSVAGSEIPVLLPAIWSVFVHQEFSQS